MDVEQEPVGAMQEEQQTVQQQQSSIRRRYIYDLANPVIAMRHLLEDLAHVREILKYLESPECRYDMENDMERIREHIKDHTIIFRGLIQTKERFETIVIRNK